MEGVSIELSSQLSVETGREARHCTRDAGIVSGEKILYRDAPQQPRRADLLSPPASVSKAGAEGVLTWYGIMVIKKDSALAKNLYGGLPYRTCSSLRRFTTHGSIPPAR